MRQPSTASAERSIREINAVYDALDGESHSIGRTTSTPSTSLGKSKEIISSNSRVIYLGSSSRGQNTLISLELLMIVIMPLLTVTEERDS